MANAIRMLIECAITMSAVALLLLALTPLLSKRYSARSLYLAWMIVLIGFLIPFRPQLAPAAIQVPVQMVETRPARRQGPTIYEEAPVPQSGEGAPEAQADPLPSGAGVAAAQTEQAASSDASLSITPAQGIAAVWLLGALVTLLCRLHAHLRFTRMVRRWSRPVKDPALLQAFDRARTEVGIRAPVQLRTCRPIDSPMLVGLFRPKVLLPEASIAADEAALILRHELVHLRHGDLWGRLLLLITSTVHWFNPLMIPIAKATTFHCEAACDGAVMHGMGLEERHYYGETILAMIRRKPGLGTALSTQYNGGLRTIKRRILNILDTRLKKMGTVVVSGLLVVVLSTGMAFALQSDEERQLILSLLEGNGEPTYAEQDRDAYQRYARQNAALYALMERYGYVAAAEAGTAMERTIPYNLALGMEAEEVDRLLESPQSTEAEALAQLLDAQLLEQTDEVPGYVVEYLDALIETIGFEALPIRRYRTAVAHYPKGYTARVIQASGMEPNESGIYPVLYLYLLESQETQALSVGSFYGYLGRSTRNGTPLRAEQKEAVRERAVAFCETHGQMFAQTHEVVFVSDDGYHIDGYEPYALAWVFDYSVPGSAEDPYELTYFQEDHGQNIGGYLVAIGLESGNIYEYYPMAETEFLALVLTCADWEAKNRDKLPIASSELMWQTVGPALESHLTRMQGQYAEALSSKDRTMLKHMRDLPLGEYLPVDSDWPALLMDLGACDSAEALARILNKPYQGITAAEKGMIQRAEAEALAKAVFAEVGYAQVRDVAALVSGDVWVVYGEDEGEAGANAASYLNIQLDGDGRLNAFWAAGPWMMIRIPMEDAQRALLTETALRVVNEYSDAGVVVDATDITVSDWYCAGGDRGGEPYGYAFVQTGMEDAWDMATETDIAVPSGYMAMIGVETGRLYELYPASQLGYESRLAFDAQEMGLQEPMGSPQHSAGV